MGQRVVTIFNKHILEMMKCTTDESVIFKIFDWSVDPQYIGNPRTLIYTSTVTHHHSTQLSTVGKWLFKRASHLCDAEHIGDEPDQVKNTLHQNRLPVPRQRCQRANKLPTVERKLYSSLIRKWANICIEISEKKISLQCAGVYKLDCDCSLSSVKQREASVLR